MLPIARHAGSAVMPTLPWCEPKPGMPAERSGDGDGFHAPCAGEWQYNHLAAMMLHGQWQGLGLC